jgi:hypothetical protein
MNNISYPKSFGLDKDNGERIIYWNSVDSRLPNLPGTYLVTYSTGEVGMEGFNNGEFHIIHYDASVIAWADLPMRFKLNKL